MVDKYSFYVLSNSGVIFDLGERDDLTGDESGIKHEFLKARFDGKEASLCLLGEGTYLFEFDEEKFPSSLNGSYYAVVKGKAPSSDKKPVFEEVLATEAVVALVKWEATATNKETK